MRQFLVVFLICGWAASAADLSNDHLGAPFLEEGNSWLERAEATSIQIDRTDGRVVITFSGSLESAAALGGPWTEIPEAVSPFRPDTTTALQKFYRAGPTVVQGLFASRTLVQWVVTGPLQTHFELAFAGVPDGIFPPRREKPYFDGSVTMAGTTVAASFRVRGNSSLLECPFPKLKLKVSREEREGTPFFDAREIKVGTHCADGGRGNIGRLRDERATFREALAYEAMELLGFVSPRVRRARIEFRDTSPVTGPDTGGWQVVRQAVLLEDQEVVAERLGGLALDDTELAELHDARFGQQLIADLRFFHVLLGNWDYTLSEDGRGLWNTDVIRLADGKLIPLAGDFDLSSWVTEQVRLTFPRDYHPELPDRDRQVRYEFDQIRGSVTPAVFGAARDRFVSRRADLESLIQAAVVDDAGRTNAVAHVATFFDGLAVADR